MVLAGEADACDLGVWRVEGCAEGIEVLVVGRSVAVADCFGGAEVVGVGAAPARGGALRPVVLGRFGPPRDRGPQGRTRRKAAARGRGQNGGASP